MFNWHQSYFKIICRLFCIIILLLTCILTSLWLWVEDPLDNVLSYPVSPILLDAHGNIINAQRSANDEWCLPIPLDQMGEWLPKVLLAVEDKRFFEHTGIDFLALSRAVMQNITQGRVVSGASTISTQLVRLSTPRKRNIYAKIHEFIGAWKLERHLYKNQILEYYLNLAPFGGPIRGVEAASRLYFGKQAQDLSLGEAALLIGMLKGPTLYRPDRNPKGAQMRRSWIISKVAEEAGFPEDLTALALEEPLPRYHLNMPDKAAHFALLAYKALPKTGGIIHSTILPDIQNELELVLRQQLDNMPEEITAAGIAVDNKTASILAYVGNTRFDPVKGKEWVDCALAPRSPGSTLKPFIYIAAMEQGDIIPATLIADSPLRLGGEAPRNFDRHYRGPISIRRALADSLNAPAVRVLRMVGVQQTLQNLRAAGFSYLNRSDSDYGDSLALGAGEVSLLELARSYTALASMGKDRPLVFHKHGKGHTYHLLKTSAKVLSKSALKLTAHAQSQLPSGLSSAADIPVRQLYSQASSYLVTDILTDSTRLPFLAQVSKQAEDIPIAFKTGTSFGLRDAWAAAYTPQYTVVIWIGKAGGGADPRLTGIAAAAPAALNLLRNMIGNEDPAKLRYEMPLGVSKVRVCKLSGKAPSDFCPHTVLADCNTETWRTIPCNMHRIKDGKIEIAWPPELEDFRHRRIAEQDLSRIALITSPLRDGQYMITPGVRLQSIALKAEGVVYPVHWYASGEYLGEQKQADLPIYWLPTAGTHTISLLDAENRTDALKTTIIDLGAKVHQETVPVLQ